MCCVRNEECVGFTIKMCVFLPIFVVCVHEFYHKDCSDHNNQRRFLIGNCV